MTRPTPLRFALRAGAGAAYALGVHLAIRGGGASRGPVALAALLAPALTSAALGIAFARTLRPGAEPMITRVARRMERDEIPPPLIAWLRQVTVAWCVFFALHAVVCTCLALLAPVAWWTLWNGVFVYAGVAVLLLGEYVVRKIRYRWYHDGLLDRFWRRAFPPFDGPAQGSGPSSSVT